MGLAQIRVLALVIFAAQAVTSSVWLRFFRFGPVKWAWRCLTYKRRFPIRREA